MTSVPRYVQPPIQGRTAGSPRKTANIASISGGAQASRCRRTGSELEHALLAAQPPRAPEEDDGHEGVHHEDGPARDDEVAESAGESEEQAADDGARERADAPNDHHDEGGHHSLRPDRGLEAPHGRGNHAR